MKRSLIFVLLIFILFSGCHLFTPENVPQDNDIFFLTDRDGNPTTSFATGEDFHMHFNLINTTQDTLDYSYTGPPVRFTIYNGLFRVVGSMDGLFFAQVLIENKLAPGDTLKGFWMAPTPPIMSTKVNLAPGRYRAVVDFPAFEELQTDTISSIIFTVTK
jgi:hypothetical protein